MLIASTAQDALESGSCHPERQRRIFSSLLHETARFFVTSFLRMTKKKTAALKGAQIRETTGFDRIFSAHTAQKNPEIHQVFPDFSILSGRKISRSKLLCTQKASFLCRARRKAQEYLSETPNL